MEVEAISGERENVFGKLRGVRVRVCCRRALLRWRLAGGRRERRLHAKLAFPTAALGGDVFRRGEGDWPEREKWWRREVWVAEETVVVGFS